jgi:hypothetical protein
MFCTASAAARQAPLVVTPARGGSLTVFTAHVRFECGGANAYDNCDVALKGPGRCRDLVIDNPNGDLGDALARIRLAPRRGLRGRPVGRADSATATSVGPVTRPIGRWCSGRYQLLLSDERGIRVASFCVARLRCARPPAACHVPGGRVVLASDGTTLWDTSQDPPGAGLYGCRPSGQSPILLQREAAGTGAVAGAISGDWVSWTTTSNGFGSSSSVANARNLRSSAALVAPHTNGPTRSLVTNDGTLAFGAPGIVGLVNNAATTTLASGNGVDGDSLTMDSDRRLIFWIQDGSAHSYQIPKSQP